MADIIVIGSSAGGLAALRRIVSGLAENLPAAVFIVQHVAPDGPCLLPEILGRDSTLPVAAAMGKPSVPDESSSRPPTGTCCSGKTRCGCAAGRMRTGPARRSIRCSVRRPLCSTAARRA